MEVRCQPLTGESMRWLTDTVYGVSNPHDAAARNRVSKIKKYVQQGGDVSKKNKLGDTPLHEACAYIRDNGATSKGKGRNGCIGVRRRMGKLAQEGLGEGGPLEMLELLVRAGSDINAQNIVGDAPLHKAALNGRVLAAGYLIRAGADVNVRNEFAQTPLHMACVSGSIEVVQKLVQGGADTNAQDATEETPFHEACRHQYENIVIYLMRQVENADTSEDLRLWRGLDASRKKSIRTRVQDRVDSAGDKEQHPPASALTTAPAAVAPASASAGSSPDELEMSTPSTLRNSMPSAESSRGRTPPGSQKFSGSQNTVGGGVILSNGSSKTKSISSPMEAMAKITNSHNGHRALREEQTNVAMAHATAKIEDRSMMAPTNDVADVAGSDDGTQGKKDIGKGGVEVGSVLLTSTREGRGVLRPEVKASPSAAGRATPPSRVPTREGVRRASARKSSNVLVLQSPRPRVSRRSLTHPDFAKESVRTGRDVGSKAGDTNGREGSSRRSPSFPEGGSHTHAVGSRSRKSAAPVDAENISGSGSGPNSPKQFQHCSRKREDSGGACGRIGVDVDVDGHVVARKSSHRQRRHRNRDLDSKRSPPARDKTVQHRHEGVEILCRDGHSQWFYGDREAPQQHSEEADGIRKERGTSASSRGGKKHRRDHCSGNGSGSGSGSARDIPQRVPKCGRSASGAVVAPGNISPAVKVGVEGAKMTIPRTGTSCAHNGSPRKEVQRKTKVVAREKSRGGQGRSVKRPHRLSGSGQELVLAPPTWASEIDIGLGKLLPYKKKVIEFPVPVKRNSPYVPYRVSSPSPRLKSGGAAMRAKVSPRKDGFFPLGTSHSTPRARTPASSRREPEDVLLGAAADSSPPAPFISIGYSRKASVANGAVAAGVSGAAPASKSVFDTDTEDDDPPGIEALHAGLSAAGAGAGTSANGVEVIVRGEGGTSVKLTSWAKTSVTSSVKRAATANSQGAVVFSDSDTDNDRASSGGVQASAASTTFGNLRSIPATPAPAHPPVPPSVEPISSFLPCAGTTIKGEDVELTTEKLAEGAASSLDFHGSFGASFPTSPGQGSRAVVDATVAAEAAPNTSVTFPSSRNELGVTKSLSEYGSGGGAGSIPTKRAWVAGVRAAEAESKAIEGAVRVEEPLAVDLGGSSRSFDSCSTQDSGKRVTDLESEALTPQLPTVAPSPATFEGASSIKPSSALIPIPLPAKSDKSMCGVNISRSQASAPAAEEESAEEAPVEREAKTVLEASTVPISTTSHAASPREPVKSMPASMIASLSPKLPAGSRKHSSLGRRGQPLVKVNMPIVGGQAAWNKFLADAVAEGEGTCRIEDDDAAGSAFHGDEARGSVDAEKDGEKKEYGDDQDPLHIERAPRGFKNPVQAEGSNKGPAGAFSGNSMWRLAGGATSAANHTRSGLKVNGDGGFSNPLAARRASSARKTPEIGKAEGGAARGGGSLNPLSGLRGATAMNGVGIANPLARGRSLRLGTAGAVNLPLDGIGAGTTNPMARRATSAAFAAPTGGYDRERPGERTRLTTIMGDRSRVDSTGRRNEIPSAFAPSIVQLAEKSLRMYDLALPSSAGLASSGGAVAEAGRGVFKEPLSSEAASAVRPSGGVEVLQRGGFRSNGRPPPPRLRRERTVHENELLEADRDPGQAKVATAVMAFQKVGNPPAGMMIKDPHQKEVSTVAEQGLVQLRRVNWSPLTVQTSGP